MFKFLILVILLATGSCANASSETNSDNHNVLSVEKNIVQNCNSDLEETIKTLFNGFGFNEEEINRDENFLKELEKCPREETINSLQILRNKRKDDFEILAKTSYLLIKLGHKKNENGKILVSSYSLCDKTLDRRFKDRNYIENLRQNKYNTRFEGFRILYFLSDVIENDDKEIISETIDLSLKTDNANAEIISHIFGREFEKSPEDFLKRLKPKSKKIRQQIYSFIYYSNGKQAVKESLSSIPKDSDTISIVNEMERFAIENKYVSESPY